MKPTFIAVLTLCFCLPLVGADKEKELPKDFKSLKALAEKGDAKAQFLLGDMYASGSLGKNDLVIKEAVKWYRKSAEQGYARAQFFLGTRYEFGEGVLEDDATAYAWYKIAAANGFADAKINKSILAKELTPDQIAKAEALTKEMIKKNPKLIK